MHQMEFNVLKRAQNRIKETNNLDRFFNEKGIDINQVRKNPEYYEGLIMQYSRTCIDQELFEVSKEHMEEEFNRLCEFHRRNEENLVNKFFMVAKNFISEVKEVSEYNK